MNKTAEEKRSAPRAQVHFVVSYVQCGSHAQLADDVCQTKDLSLGGVRMTTARSLAPESEFTLKIRLPINPNPMSVTGKVLESREIRRDSIYDTRFAFSGLEDANKKLISDTVSYFLRKQKLKGA